MQPLNTEMTSGFPLAMAQEGEQVKVTLYRGGKNQQMRLTELGLNVGCELHISHRQGANMVVIRGETRLAVGAGIAQKVMVIRV